MDQTKKNRQLPRVECKKCGAAFSTQWATEEADLALPRGLVVSERFEQGRNFCNKLWNASRFALINLEGFEPAPIEEAQLTLEDLWLLSRLSTVTGQVTEAVERYRYADAARTLYDFFWDEFCSSYVEISKARFQDEATKRTAQAVLAHALDTLLRLLHPMIPFITEEIWQLLAQIAPQRGWTPATRSESIMQADWPQMDPAHQDPQIEAQFAKFQTALGAVREIRTHHNLSKEQVKFCIRCDEQTVAMLSPMETYFTFMANAVATELGPQVSAPEVNAALTVAGMDIYVDLDGLVDPAVEMERLQKREQQITKQLRGKEGKLSNEGFVSRAPAEVVQKERDALAQLKQELEAVQVEMEAWRNRAT